MKPKISFSFKKFPTFFRKYCLKAVYLILILYLLYILFFLYQYLFLPLAETQPIDPTLIQSKKEMVNQGLFDNVVQRMEEKTTYTYYIPIDIEDPLN